MTISPVAGAVEDKTRLKLPGKPYTALRLRKVN
jgi:hypothetical protein